MARANVTPRQWAALAAPASGTTIPAVAARPGLPERVVRHQLRRSYWRLSVAGSDNPAPAAVAWYLREGHRQRPADER
jgi:DNA-binding NarL/FixJ family response regulator